MLLLIIKIAAFAFAQAKMCVIPQTGRNKVFFLNVIIIMMKVNGSLTPVLLLVAVNDDLILVEMNGNPLGACDS